MASTAITKLIEQSKRIQAAAVNRRRKDREKSEQLYEGAAQLGGGLIGGAIDGYLADGDEHTILGAPTALVGGLLVAAIGFADLVPGSNYVAALGLGSACYGGGNMLRDKLAAK